jgi:hypothetical protein
LLQTKEIKKILKEYTPLGKNKVPPVSFIVYTGVSFLKEFSSRMGGWNQFKENPDDFIESREQVFTISEKNKKLYKFIDAVTRNQHKGRITNIHEACVNHYFVSHISDRYKCGST